MADRKFGEGLPEGVSPEDVKNIELEPQQRTRSTDAGGTIDDVVENLGGASARAGGELTGGEIPDSPGNPGADDEVGAGGAGAGDEPNRFGEPPASGDAARAGARTAKTHAQTGKTRKT